MIGLSQDSTDRLIRELIQTGRTPRAEEIQQIIDRLAIAPFDERSVPVPVRLRGVAYEGHVLGARENTLTLHLIKRVVDERQWATGTSATDYVASLHRAVRASRRRLAIYGRRSGHIAVVVTPTAAAMPTAWLTPHSLPNLLVVYSADRGIILSGYQFSALDHTGIPKEARWLN